MKSWYTIRARDEGAELSIYDEIGAYGVTAKAFIADLGALASGSALELRLNSPGGSVFERALRLSYRRPGDPHPFVDNVAWRIWLQTAYAGALNYVRDQQQ